MMAHRTFSNYFIGYLMKKYELYLTFSIIIISTATETETVLLHVMTNLSRQAHHQLEIVFLRSAFLETADQTSPSDYRPIVIGSRSIGAPLLLTSNFDIISYQVIHSLQKIYSRSSYLLKLTSYCSPVPSNLSSPLSQQQLIYMPKYAHLYDIAT